jgi:oligosaccharide reducing-end xylanase
MKGMAMGSRILLSLIFGFGFIGVNSYASGPNDSAAFVPSPGAYFSGHYENTFSRLLGIPDSNVAMRLETVFERIFYGNDTTERLYYPSGADMAYIKDVNNDDVRTEGMSYGMMICVQMNKKSEFDRLWKWASTYMKFGQGPHKGYFAWHCRTDGTVLDSTAASDGEEWFVTSLFFASARWGDGKGIYNYRAEGQEILNTMLHKDSEPGHGDVTNMFNGKNYLVGFVPNRRGLEFTDPSYQLPHYYELWARWANKDNQFWCDAASASRVLLQKAAHPTTGLSPDYSRFDGTPFSPWGGGHDDFRFDAWRVAMNVSIDYVWFAKDPWEVTEANRLLDFFYAQGVRTFGNQYTIDGKKLSEDHSPGLVGMNAVAAIISTNANRKEFIEELWNTPVPKGFYRYYDGMLYTLAMLQVSGNFRIYHCTSSPVPACSGD